jgi:hypothetical protein
MRWMTRGHLGERRASEDVKYEGWREQNLLIVSPADPQLTWPERELVRQLGEKLYGGRLQSMEKSRE